MKYRLQELIDIPRLRGLLETLDEIHSMPSAIIDIEGNVLIANAWQDICTRFHRLNPETEKKCIESDTHISVELLKRTPHVVYRCPMGLVDSATPLIIEGEHLGNVFTGQLFIDQPDEAQFIAQARQYGFDEAAYLAAMRTVPYFSEGHLHRNLNFIHSLTQMLAEQGLHQKRLYETKDALANSERKFRNLFEYSRDACLLIRGARFISCNQAAADSLHAKSITDVVNRSPWDISPEYQPDGQLSRDKARSVVAKAIETGSNRFEWVHRRLDDGVEFPVEVSLTRLPDGIIYVLWHDISERKQSEEHLRISESLFRNLFDNHVAVKLVIDPENGNLVNANQAAAEFYGWPVEKLKTMNIAQINTLPAQEITARIKDVKDNRKSTFDFRHRRADGSIRDVRIFCSKINTYGNEYLYTIVHDITAQKRAEDELNATAQNLRQANQHLTTLVDCLSDWIWEVDAAGRYRYCSPQVEAVLGYAPAEMIGKSPFDFMGREEAQRTRALFLDAVRQRERLIDLENWCIARDGERILLQTNGVPIYDEQRNFIGYRGVDRNITSDYRNSEIIKAKAYLVQLSLDHSTDDLFEAALNIAERLTDSCIGFFHLVDDDQLSLKLQCWSNKTKEEFCTAAPHAVHYALSEAGVWVDCIHQRRAVIHNDYTALPHRKGLPAGHANVVRELVVPLIRNDKIKAILGVGNKAADYTEQDIETIAALANQSWEILERMRAQEELKSALRFNSSIIDCAQEGIVVYDKELHYQLWNPYMENLTGLRWDAVKGKTAYDFPFMVENGVVDDLKKILNGETYNCREFKDRIPDTQRDGWVVQANAPLYSARGEIIGVLGMIRDLTEHKRTSEQLLQAQKMEAIGQLAGGVAHDFNNMLTIIGGYANLGLIAAEPSSAFSHYFEEILKTSERSASLTRQLLAFARKQTISPQALNLNETVSAMLKMLTRLIGEDIQLTWQAEANLWQIRMDPSQVDQILANLCVNARDAIKNTGRITIETHNRIVDAYYYHEHPDSVPGEYVRLSVSDDGCGMDRETLAHIFEPFYTTKAVGKGTGLGLATVFGIVKQNRGFVNVYSEPGKGTTFSIYIPRFVNAGASSEVNTAPAPLRRGQETILLVEDEPAILSIASIMLEGQGYTVLTAETPGEAIGIAERYAGVIHLLMTDVIMPEMNGRDLAKKLISLYPDMKRIFMSGYTADIIAHHGVLEQDVHFIQKPFALSSLTAKVREVLDGSGPV